MKLSLSILIASLFFIFNCQVSESLSSISTSVNGISTSSNSISKLSDSVQSISGSIQSISGSSSRSSSGDKEKEKAYLMDVRDLTAIYSKNGFNQEFNSDLSTIAQKNGIINWKSDSTTYIGIGEGLKKANVSEYEFKTFLNQLDPQKNELQKLLAEGYKSL